MIKKRGLAEIISTLGLVLLTFAAIVIIGGFIVPFVKDNLNESTECVDYKEYFTFEEEFGYNCLNSSNNEYWISVRADLTDEETANKVEMLKISFVEDNENEIVDIKDGERIANVRMLNGTDVLVVPKRGEVRTYIYSSAKSFKRVDVFPVLASGKACEKSDSINLIGEC